MKKIVVICSAFLLGIGAASAQYLCPDKGAVLTFTATSYKDADPVTLDYQATVIEAATAEDGKISTRVEEVHKVPGNDLMEIKSYNSYTYNPADGLTVHTLLTGDDYKAMIVNMLIEGARNAGQTVSEADLNELDKGIRVRGELTIDLPAEPVADSKLANKSIKLSIATNSMSMNLWEGKHLGFEDVETPAGKFENCEKVSYVIKVNSPEGNEKTYCTAWYAKGIGVVKTLETDKKGKVQSEEVLKSIKK
ncbi:MAG: hypothetical protein K2F91_01585 [Muribaculaceae bacterium]|nr:hypothetical protein [Muribaculaceae bacterium]